MIVMEQCMTSEWLGTTELGVDLLLGVHMRNTSGRLTTQVDGTG